MKKILVGFLVFGSISSFANGYNEILSSVIRNNKEAYNLECESGDKMKVSNLISGTRTIVECENLDGEMFILTVDITEKVKNKQTYRGVSKITLKGTDKGQLDEIKISK